MRIEQALREGLEHLIKHPPSRPALIIIKRILWAIVLTLVFNLFTSWQILYDNKIAPFFWGFLLARLPTFCFELVIAYYIVGIFSASNYKKRYQLFQQYFDKNLDNFTFSNKNLTDAAIALRNFKPATYDHAVKTHGQIAVDILLLTSMIDQLNGNKFSRIVSLKAIEENREADEREDQD